MEVECSICSQKFSSKDALMKHLRFKCTKCLTKFCKVDAFFKHLRHKCHRCSSNFCSKAALQKHLSHKCTTNKAILGKHLRSVKSNQQAVKTDINAGERNSLCHICGQMICSEDSLSRQIQQSRGEIKKCCNCKRNPYSGDYQYKLRNHIAEHIADPNYKGNLSFGCISCSAEFKSHLSLYSHALFVHNNSALKQCHTCGLITKGAWLKTHSKYCGMLNKEKSVPCVICNCKCENYKAMVGHMTEDHGKVAYEAYQKILLEIPLSKSELDIFRKGGDTSPFINSKSQVTVSNVTSPTFNEKCLASDAIHQDGESSCENYASQKMEEQNGKVIDLHKTQHGNINNGQKIIEEEQDLKNDPPDCSTENATYDGNITGPPATLESIDLDLTLLCNFLGNDSRTETRI